MEMRGAWSGWWLVMEICINLHIFIFYINVGVKDGWIFVLN